MRVSKDAKYSVTASGEIQLVYRVSRRERYLLSTEEHPTLVNMVNDVKRELTDVGVGGGAFYINEYRDVLVPDGIGGQCFWAGNYETSLEFAFGDLRISSRADPGLDAGDEWQGPHVGIPYVLVAGATDIRYEKIEGYRRETVLLSDFCGHVSARTLAQRLGKHKGQSGGRIFINEHAEFFTRIDTADNSSYIYLGALGEDSWFPPPSGFSRP